MFSVYNFLTVDPALGRFEKSSLSQQTLMELVTQGLTSKEYIYTDQADIRNLEKWGGVSVNESEEVFDIEWHQCYLMGHVDLRWLPSTLERVFIHGNLNVTGSVDLTDLPEGLKNIGISRNGCSGEVCLTQLPKELFVLDLSENQLNGSLDLTTLPLKMTEVCLNDNAFSGTIDLTQLPPRLIRLYLHGNPLEGETDFSRLVDSLCFLHVYDTNLSGKLYCLPGKQHYVTGSQVELVKVENCGD